MGPSRLDGKWLLYHGSLAMRHQSSATALNRLKSGCAGSLFVDVNLRPPWWQREPVLEMVNGADWLKLNEQELVDIYPGASGSEERIRMLAELVSEQIVLTGGEAGAHIISSAEQSRV